MKDKLTAADIRRIAEEAKAAPVPEGLYVEIDGVKCIDISKLRAADEKGVKP